MCPKESFLFFLFFDGRITDKNGSRGEEGVPLVSPQSLLVVPVSFQPPNPPLDKVNKSTETTTQSVVVD